MARHEFGIMDPAPQCGQRYDDYEPEKYGCIAVDDELVERFAEDLAEMDCYWHTLDRRAKGLAYCGVTLIPPASLNKITAVLGENAELSELRLLLETAEKGSRFVIHFGI